MNVTDLLGTKPFADAFEKTIVMLVMLGSGLTIYIFNL